MPRLWFNSATPHNGCLLMKSPFSYQGHGSPSDYFSSLQTQFCEHLSCFLVFTYLFMAGCAGSLLLIVGFV